MSFKSFWNTFVVIIMTKVSFEWTSPIEIHPALIQNALGSIGAERPIAHLQEVERLGLRLGASPMARQNAVRLASGYGDLVVVLLEPSDLAEKVPYDEMMKHSTALQRVDETLNLAFQGNRKVDNTIILDRRPFRSNEIQWEQGENEATRKRNNETAYKDFEQRLKCCVPRSSLYANVKTQSQMDSHRISGHLQ